jgi:hypothetical protein
MKIKYNCFIFTLFCSLLLQNSMSYALEDNELVSLETDLLVYFPFDGDGKDYSGHNYHATLTNTSGFGVGKYGQSFVVGEGYAKISQPALLQGLSAYTVSTWININRYNADRRTSNYIYNDIASSIKNYLSANEFKITYPRNTNSINHVDDILAPTIWHHVAHSWDPQTSEFKAYLNGNLQYQASYTDIEEMLIDNEMIDGFFYIGARNEESNQFNGAIDEFKIFKRALTVTEIQNLAEQTQVSYNNNYDEAYQAGIQAVKDNPAAYGIAGDSVLFDDYSLVLPSVLYGDARFRVILQGDDEFTFIPSGVEPLD